MAVGITAGITPDITLGITPGVTPGITRGLTARIATGITLGLTTGITLDITPVILARITAGITPGVTRTVPFNSLYSTQPCNSSTWRETQRTGEYTAVSYSVYQDLAVSRLLPVGLAPDTRCSVTQPAPDLPTDGCRELATSCLKYSVVFVCLPAAQVSLMGSCSVL